MTRAIFIVMSLGSVAILSAGLVSLFFQPIRRLWPYTVLAPATSLIFIYAFLMGAFFLYGESPIPANESKFIDGGLLILPTMAGFCVGWGIMRIIAVRRRRLRTIKTD
jgi:hypothetical protein